MTREISQHGDFQVASAPCAQGGGFFAWAKRGEITGTNPITEPGDEVWFEVGPSRDVAVARLLADIGRMN